MNGKHTKIVCIKFRNQKLQLYMYLFTVTNLLTKQNVGNFELS